MQRSSGKGLIHNQEERYCTRLDEVFKFFWVSHVSVHLKKGERCHHASAFGGLALHNSDDDGCGS